MRKTFYLLFCLAALTADAEIKIVSKEKADVRSNEKIVLKVEGVQEAIDELRVDTSNEFVQVRKEIGQGGGGGSGGPDDRVDQIIAIAKRVKDVPPLVDGEYTTDQMKDIMNEFLVCMKAISELETSVTERKVEVKLQAQAPKEDRKWWQIFKK